MQLSVHVVCYVFIEDISNCVVKHIATDLCFKIKLATYLIWLCVETAQIATCIPCYNNGAYQ